MSCDICARGSCCAGFHSHEEQDRFAKVIEAFDKARELRAQVNREADEEAIAEEEAALSAAATVWRKHIAAASVSQAVPPTPSEPQSWLPIETALKGRKVLAGYFNKRGNWRTVTACYYLPQTLQMAEDRDDLDDDGYAPEGWYEESGSQENILPTDEPPTHWMPLPKPPAASQRQQAQPTGETK